MNRSSHSSTSEDSQTLLVDTPSSPSSSHQSPKPFPPSSTGHATAGSSTAPPAPEPRKCWICFSDETEDTPADSEWVSPCPCALTAHQACLLDWVADLKAPNRKDAKKVQCPQCKADIKVAQPRSRAVEVMHGFERVRGRMIILVGGVSAVTALVGACYAHGLASITFMMGTADAARLLGIHRAGGRENHIAIAAIPFIPVALGLSMTSLADGIWPVLPMLFLINRQRPIKNGPLWPPSMMMTLCAMPYIRSIYNGVHKNVIAPREKAWLKEIQPRGALDADEPANDAAVQPEPQDAAAHNMMDFELGVQVEVIEEEEVEIEQPQPNNAPAPPGNDNQAPPPHPPNQAQPALPPNFPAPPAQFQRHINVDLNATVNTIFGALLFPTIATGMGAVLYGLLPSRFTTTPRANWRYGLARQTGLLQSRWGRSLLGGLLFVVLKDALVFWTRWSMKEDHKRRRVLNLGEEGGEIEAHREGIVDALWRWVGR